MEEEVEDREGRASICLLPPSEQGDIALILPKWNSHEPWKGKQTQ